MSFQSTTAIVLKRGGNLLKLTDVPSSPPVSSGWRETMDYSSVNGILGSNPRQDAEIVIEQSIDGQTVDKSETIVASKIGQAEAFEVRIIADYVKVDLNITGDPTNVRAITYMSTRASSQLK